MALESNMTVAPGIDPTQYYPSPYSLFTIDDDFRVGLLILGALGMLSVIAVLPVIAFITYRLALSQNIHLNQPVILCFNLLIADTFQAVAFLCSFHWVIVGGILAPSSWCQVQAAVLNIGDLSSGFFVLSIALHTCYTVVRGRKLPQSHFAGCVCFVWFFALFLSIIGPVIHGTDFFARSGGWCWISPKYETERLLCHYLWTFINEFGTVCIYAFVFLYLQRKMRRMRNNHENAAISANVSRATRFMVLYPAIFVLATLPLAIGRMASAGGTTFSNSFFFVAGSLLASCGWLDATLYTLTRRILVYSDSRLASSTPHRYRQESGDGSYASGGIMSPTWASPLENKEMDIMKGPPKSHAVSSKHREFDGRPYNASLGAAVDPMTFMQQHNVSSSGKSRTTESKESREHDREGKGSGTLYEASTLRADDSD